MDGKALARLAVVIIVAVAGTAAAIYVARDGSPSISNAAPATTSDTPGADPLRTTLEHCLELGAVAVYDHDCLAAWSENRRRFLTPSEGR